MKKILILMLALAVAVSISACNGNDEAADNGENVTEEQTGDVSAEISAENPEENAEVQAEKVENEAELTEEDIDSAEETVEKKEEKNEDKKETSQVGKAEATAAADGFMGAVCSWDIALMTEYSNADMAVKTGFSNLKEYIYSNTFDDATAGEEDEFKKLAYIFADGVTDSMDYEITDSEYNDGVWTFYVDMEYKTVKSILPELKSDEMNQLTETMFDVLVEEVGLETDPEKLEEIANRVMVDFVESAGEILEESIEAIEPSTGKCVLKVIDKDGEWVVDVSASDCSTVFDIVSFS